MGLAKRDFNRAVLGNLEQVLDYEAHIQEIAGKGYEHKEGVTAFLEKRPRASSFKRNALPQWEEEQPGSRRLCFSGAAPDLR
jgi:hypothetical protein